MSIGNLSGRKAVFGAALLIAVVLAVYFWRDLHLGVGDMTKIPDIVVENITVERDIEGKHWTFISPRVEHKDGMISGQSIDITIKEPSGGESKLFALEGTFARDNNDVTLRQADGEMLQGGKKYSITAGEAYYEAVAETWHFSEGIVLKDASVEVRGAKGSFNMKFGECRLTNGCTVRWKK